MHTGVMNVFCDLYILNMHERTLACDSLANAICLFARCIFCGQLNESGTL